MPLIIGAVMGISFFAERTAQTNIEEAASRVSDAVIVDESGLIDTDIVSAFDLRVLESAESTLDQVKSGDIFAAIIYPEDLSQTRRFQVYLSEGDDFVLSSAMSDLGQQLLRASLLAPIGDEQIAELLMSGASSQVTAYENGEPTAGVYGYVVPGIFLAIFFVVLFFSMGYMLLGVAEEKENRSMEMVLSYLKPKTLITGKLLSVGLVALTQLLFFLVLGAGAFVAFNRFEEQLGSLPFDIDLSAIAFDPVTIIVGISVLILGFLMFAALMSGVASMAPGVKEANSFSGAFFILPFIPFWSFGLISTGPDSPVVQALTFFPVTAPTTIMLRNTLGNIGPSEAALAIAALAVFTILAFMLAAKLFRLGALEYADRLKLSSIFKK